MGDCCDSNQAHAGVVALTFMGVLYIFNIYIFCAIWIFVKESIYVLGQETLKYILKLSVIYL